MSISRNILDTEMEAIQAQVVQLNNGVVHNLNTEDLNDLGTQSNVQYSKKVSILAKTLDKGPGLEN